LASKRVSLGGSLARAVLSTLERAGPELLDTGTLSFLDGAISYADMQRRFGSRSPSRHPEAGADRPRRNATEPDGRAGHGMSA
jgi:hypothetical protein